MNDDLEMKVCELQNDLDNTLIREEHLRRHAEAIFKKNEELEEQLKITTDALAKISGGTDQTRSATHISKRALDDIFDFFIDKD